MFLTSTKIQMKKTGLFLAVPLTAAVLCSCSGKHKEVADFAADFARKAQAGQVDSLKTVYPQIEDADSIAIKFVADSLSVEDTDNEGIYRVNFGGGVTATVRMDENGRMTVADTKGLFAYPKEKVQFAEKTGALKGEMTDAEKAKRMTIVDLMAEDIYEKYSAKRKNAVVNLGFTVTRDIMFMMDTGAGYYTLKNTTDEPVKGSEYTITWEDAYIGMGGDRTSHRTQTGKDIPANGTVRFPIQFTGHDSSSISKITMKELSNEEFMAIYTPVGNEYEAFIKENGDAISNAGKKLGDGPYYIQGKLGGKYAVHITLKQGMKDGLYYYDKNGPTAKLELKVQDFNPKTGKLKLEEHNDKGQVTGTFTGTLSETSFVGKMTSFQGKVYDFDMKVTK